MTIALDQLPAEDFDALLAQALPARAGELCIELVVDEVWRCPYPTGRALPGFSLFLRGPAEPRLAQGMIELDHPRHGTLALFITPVARDAAGMRYEAVFN